jgi:hypothetical protein
MEMFDQILIDHFFSPLAGWLQHRFGVNQWRVSLECLNGNVAFYLAGIALSIAGKGLNDGIFVDLLRGVGWLLIVDFARRVALRQAASSIGVQSARMGEWLIRLILVASFPVSVLTMHGVTNLCFTVSLLFLVLHLYFKASDTPPPEPRRKLAVARMGA